MVIEIFAGTQVLVDFGLAFFIWKHRQDVNTFIQKDLSFALNSITNTVNGLLPRPPAPPAQVVPPAVEVMPSNG